MLNKSLEQSYPGFCMLAIHVHLHSAYQITLGAWHAHPPEGIAVYGSEIPLIYQNTHIFVYLMKSPFHVPFEPSGRLSEMWKHILDRRVFLFI